MTSTAIDYQTFRHDWQDWHDKHEAFTGDRHGFLSITSINWLTDEPQRFADAPGTWSTDASGVHVVLDDADELVIDGKAVAGSHDFGVIAERDSLFVDWLDARVEVAKRGGHDIIRPRHPDAPAVAAYRGTPAYEPSPRWVFPGRFVPFETARPTTVDAAVDKIQHTYDAPGRVEFEIDGQPYALTLFEVGHGLGLAALFTDATSGATTYSQVRSLILGTPAEDGRLVVDFNRATNPPCAYTTFATCPLPPVENRLPIAVEAGEQLPRGKRIA